MLAHPALRPLRRRRPRPFTSEWLAATPRQRGPVLPAWFPGERLLSAALVLLLAAGVAVAG